jgi:hypothetical protein
VGKRCTEERHDGVADDLVDTPTVGDDVGGQALEASIHQVLHLLRVARLSQRCVTNEIGEEDRDKAALVAAVATE